MKTHISADVQRITLNASCMTISGGRTKQLNIFCHVTGFTSDLLSFIVVELIWFFHRALQLLSEVHNSNSFLKLIAELGGEHLDAITPLLPELCGSGNFESTPVLEF